MTLKRKNRRRGAAVVEAALMLPLLVIITFGSIDIAQYINAAQVVSNSSREGARLASRSSTDSTEDVKDTVIEYLASAFPQLSDDELAQSTKIQTCKVSHCDDSIENGDLNTVESGEMILVSVEFEFENIRWLSFMPGFNNLSTSTYCRRE